MRVTADFEQCVGSGECVLACPDVFGQDENGTVVILQEEPLLAVREQVHDAVSGCPSCVLAVRN